MANRYDTPANPEGLYQIGSNNQVLLNKLGIVNPAEMDRVELELLDQITESLVDELAADKGLSVSDLCDWHRRWLGNVYSWAGEFRSVNMGKGEFQFAAAHLIPKLMQDFEIRYLAPLACHADMDDSELIDSLAVVHIEFILIHPFREGNGRLSRLLVMIMALQAGRPVLDFSWLDKHKDEYFLAVQAGLDNDEPMKTVFRQVLLDTQRDFA